MNNYEQLPTHHLHPWQSQHEGHALPHNPGLLPYTQDGHHPTTYSEQSPNTQHSWNTSQEYQPHVVLSSSTSASQEVYWRYPTSAPSLDIDPYHQQFTTSYPAQTTSHYSIQTAYPPIGKIDTSASQLEQALGPAQPALVTQQTQVEANQFSSAQIDQNSNRISGHPTSPGVVSQPLHYQTPAYTTPGEWRVPSQQWGHHAVNVSGGEHSGVLNYPSTQEPIQSQIDSYQGSTPNFGSSTEHHQFHQDRYEYTTVNPQTNVQTSPTNLHHQQYQTTESDQQRISPEPGEPGILYAGSAQPESSASDPSSNCDGGADGLGNRQEFGPAMYSHPNGNVSGPPALYIGHNDSDHFNNASVSPTRSFTRDEGPHRFNILGHAHSQSAAVHYGPKAMVGVGQETYILSPQLNPTISPALTQHPRVFALTAEPYQDTMMLPNESSDHGDRDSSSPRKTVPTQSSSIKNGSTQDSGGDTANGEPSTQRRASDDDDNKQRSGETTPTSSRKLQRTGSGSKSSGDTAPTRLVRKRDRSNHTHIACTFCRRRKIACVAGPSQDRDIGPCMPCSKRELVCSRPSSNRRGQRNKRGSGDTLDESNESPYVQAVASLSLQDRRRPHRGDSSDGSSSDEASPLTPSTPRHANTIHF